MNETTERSLGPSESGSDGRPREPLLGSPVKSTTSYVPPGVFGSTAVKNVLLLSVGFAVLFSAFNPIQGLMTSFDEELGYYTLAAIYLTFSVANFCGPGIVSALGLRTSIVLASLTYSTFVFSLLWEPTAGVVLPASIALGFGAAVLWNGQGTYLLKNTQNEDRGTLSGVFYAIFMTSVVWGNLVAVFLLPEDKSKYPSVHFFIPFLGMTGVGAVIFMFLGKPVSTFMEWDASETVDLLQQRRFKDFFVGSLRMFTEREYLLFVPAMMYTGFSLGVYNGKIPPSMLDRRWIPWSFVVMGGGEAVGALILGKYSDRAGRSRVTNVAFGLHAVAIGLAYWADYAAEHRWVYMLSYGCFGVADGTLNTMVYAILGTFYPSREALAVAGYKFVQSVALAVVFFSQKFMSLFHAVLFLSAFLVFAIATFALMFGSAGKKRLRSPSLTSPMTP